MIQRSENFTQQLIVYSNTCERKITHTISYSKTEQLSMFLSWTVKIRIISLTLNPIATANKMTH